MRSCEVAIIWPDCCRPLVHNNVQLANIQAPLQSSVGIMPAGCSTFQVRYQLSRTRTHTHTKTFATICGNVLSAIIRIIPPKIPVESENYNGNHWYFISFHWHSCVGDMTKEHPDPPVHLQKWSSCEQAMNIYIYIYTCFKYIIIYLNIYIYISYNATYPNHVYHVDTTFSCYPQGSQP